MGWIKLLLELILECQHSAGSQPCWLKLTGLQQRICLLSLLSFRMILGLTGAGFYKLWIDGTAKWKAHTEQTYVMDIVSGSIKQGYIKGRQTQSSLSLPIRNAFSYQKWGILSSWTWTSTSGYQAAGWVNKTNFLYLPKTCWINFCISLEYNPSWKKNHGNQGNMLFLVFF